MRIVLCIWFLLVGMSGIAQSSISIGNKQDSTLIGQPITLPVKINAPLSNIASIDFSPLKEIENIVYPQDTVHLEKYFDISISGTNTFGINNDNWVVSGDQLTSNAGEITFVFYTFGLGAFPSPVMTMKDSSEVIPLQQSFIAVMPPQNYMPSLDSLEIEGIKPIIKEGAHWTDYLPILYVLLGLLAIGLLGWLFTRISRKGEEEIIIEEPVIKLPAHTIALASLDSLDEKQLWQAGKIKEYQSQLTDIMRTYIDDRYEITAMEMTTSEIMKSLTKVELADGLMTNLKDILQIADIIKFAKGTAGPEMNQKFLKDAYDWVHATKQEIRRVEE